MIDLIWWSALIGAVAVGGYSTLGLCVVMLNERRKSRSIKAAAARMREHE